MEDMDYAFSVSTWNLGFVVWCQVSFDLRLMGAVKIQGPCQRLLRIEPGERSEIVGFLERVSEVSQTAKGNLGWLRKSGFVRTEGLPNISKLGNWTEADREG